MTAAAPCARCRETAALAGGVVCGACRTSIRGELEVCPEQVSFQPYGTRSSGALLLDGWMRAHPLGVRTLVGRRGVDAAAGARPACSMLLVAEASVSREHAECRLENGRWRIEDLGSVNGTSVNGETLEGATLLVTGDVVRFGVMGFMFIELDELDEVSRHRLSGEHGYETNTRRLSGARARAGLLRLREVASGGQLDYRGVTITLTDLQVALLRYLHGAGAGKLGDYVPGSHLLGDLPWWSGEAKYQQLSGLVRRLNGKLTKAGLPALVEHQRGLGFRLAVSLDALVIV